MNKKLFLAFKAIANLLLIVVSSVAIWLSFAYKTSKPGVSVILFLAFQMAISFYYFGYKKESKFVVPRIFLIGSVNAFFIFYWILDIFFDPEMLSSLTSAPYLIKAFICILQIIVVYDTLKDIAEGKSAEVEEEETEELSEIEEEEYEE